MVENTMFLMLAPKYKYIIDAMNTKWPDVSHYHYGWKIKENVLFKLKLCVGTSK
jgi:hypothetical protein